MSDIVFYGLIVLGLVVVTIGVCVWLNEVEGSGDVWDQDDDPWGEA